MTDVTGRDRLVIGQALYWALQHLGERGEKEQPWSNIQDTKALLLAEYADIAKMMVETDRAAGREPADIIDEKSVQSHRAQ